MSEPTANEKLGDLFASHYVEVLAYCARRIGRSDAEDAAAEVFAIASRRAGDIEWSTARPWLFGIARGVLSNRWRSFHRWQKAVRTFGGLATLPMDGPDELVVRHAEDNSVLAVLKGLRQSDREVLMLAAWEELTGPEIAQSLGILGGGGGSAAPPRQGEIRHFVPKNDAADGPR